LRHAGSGDGSLHDLTLALVAHTGEAGAQARGRALQTGGPGCVAHERNQQFGSRRRATRIDDPRGANVPQQLATGFVR
jgi:hypothetical protein